MLGVNNNYGFFICYGKYLLKKVVDGQGVTLKLFKRQSLYRGLSIKKKLAKLTIMAYRKLRPVDPIKQLWQ